MIALMTLVLMSCAEKKNYDKWEVTVTCTEPATISVAAGTSTNAGGGQSSTKSYTWEGSGWKGNPIQISITTEFVSTEASYTAVAKRNNEQLPMKSGDFVGYINFTIE